jgi:hypothetical protein
MARVIAQVTLARDGGLPEDVIVNTYHFEDDSGFATEGGLSVNGPGLESRLVSFYDAIGQSVLGSSLAGTGIIKMYDFSDPLPRVPRRTFPFTFALAAGSPYPGEVAMVLSMRAELVPGVNPARRRGRVFLGPLSVGVGAPSPSGADMQIPIAKTDAVLTAARTMARGASGTFRLAVYSPATKAAGGTDDEAWNDVEVLSVDSAFDTQRRRGAAASFRRSVTLGTTTAPA